MRFAIISDIHEDVENLQKAIDRIVSSNVDEIVCLGDLVGFENNYYEFKHTRSAQKCLAILNHHSVQILSGNHELNVGNTLPFFHREIGFPDNWFSIPLKDKVHKYEHLFFLYRDEEPNDLDKKSLEQIKKLSPWKMYNTDSYQVMFSHFIYPDIHGNAVKFYNQKGHFHAHFEWIKTLNARYSFVGHLHLNGLGIAKAGRLKFKKFGLYSLSADPQIIFCPAIARGRSKSGFVLFDTKDLSIEVIQL